MRSVAPRDEGFADFAAEVAADGDVLEVGVAAGEAAGGGDVLVKVGVDALVVGGDVVGEGVDVGRLELGGLAIEEDVGGDGVLDGEEGEGLLVGGVLAGFCFFRFVDQFEFFEEDFAKLFGGVEVEFLSGGGGDGLGEVVDAVGEVDADFGEEVGVEGDAFGFHLHEDGEEGGFDGLVDFGEFVFF